MIISTLFSLSILISIPLLLFWITYRLLLAKKNMASFNRRILMGGYLTLMLVPALMHFTGIDPQPRAASASPAPETIVFEINNVPASFNRAAVAEERLKAYMNYALGYDRVWRMLLIIYMAGLTATACATGWNLARALILIPGAQCIRRDGMKIMLTNRKRVAPFSFGKYIVMTKADYEHHGAMIIAHEAGHIKHRHTLDILLAQLFAIVCWYNPAAWLMRADLKATHEYQADDYALESGLDPYSYQMLLIGMGTRLRNSPMVNTFNYSNLKNRLSMMNSKKTASRRMMAYAALPVVMLLAGLLIACSKPISRAADQAADATLTSENVLVIDDSDIDDRPSVSPLFVIRGVDLNSDAIVNGNFINMSELSASDAPDSFYAGFLLPLSKCVITWRKSTLELLSRNARTYIIDGKEADRKDVFQLKATHIQSAEIAGDTLNVVTRLYDEENPDYDMALDYENRLFLQQPNIEEILEQQRKIQDMMQQELEETLNRLNAEIEHSKQ